MRLLVLYTGAYGVGIRFGMFAYVGQEVSSFWPNSGLLCAALLLSAPRAWPLLWAIAISLDATVGGVWAGRPALAGGALGAVSCIEATVVAVGIRRWFRGAGVFDRLSGAFGFLALIVVVVSAGGVLGASVITRAFPGADFVVTWRSWCAADGLGLLIVTPLVLSIAQARRVLPASASRRLELLGVLLSTVLLAQFFFSHTGPEAFPLALLVVLPVFWAALRFDIVVSLVLCAIVVVTAVSHAARGAGPFLAVGLSPHEQAWALQAFLVGLSVMMLSVGTAIRERTVALAALERERQQLEDVVARRTEDLRAANEELDAFNHRLAHDIRNPLQALHGSAALLGTARLDREAKEDVAAIEAATSRIRELLDDMLRLSKASRGELRIERIDISALATDITEELQARDADRSVDIVIASGMNAVGDSGLVRIALFNLLENAWKYTSKCDHARIEVFSEATTGEGIRICVRDNGIGFDSDEVSGIFEAFSRLDHAKAFAGSGIGLSTVKRVVDRHGGLVGAQSTQGQGATFWFTLPDRDSSL
jgi:signal transduction histidine kinase